MDKEYCYKISISSGERELVSVDNFNIRANAITFLFGESGIGKSLLSKTIYGLTNHNELDVVLNGHDYKDYLNSSFVASVRKNAFFVFQEPSSHLNPTSSLREQIREGDIVDDRYEKPIFEYLWKGVNLSDIEELLDVFPKPHRPSGGEKQRLLLTMALKKIIKMISKPLSSEPYIYIFDEPTGSLDDNYRNMFLNILVALFRKSKFTALIVTHDYSIITEMRKKYNDIIAAVDYKELMRIEGMISRVVDFKPDDYTNWLSASHGSFTPKIGGNIVLETIDTFSVFGRNLRIEKKTAKGQISTPLIIREGEMVYVKAPSGVGKTTLAKIIMGIIKPKRWNMSILHLVADERKPVSFWKKEIWGNKATMVFQHADESLNLEARVKNIFAGLPVGNLSDSEIKSYMRNLFSEQSVEEIFDKRVKFLSGGQKQRLNILRSLILDTPLIIFDEPLNGLDFESVKKILALISKKLSTGTAVLMISHNEEIFDNLVPQSSIYYLSEVC